jgi:prevent-host-death family protein
MPQVPLTEAKDQLSRIVDAAEHRGVTTTIIRHGKPVAVVAPIQKKKKRVFMTPEQIAALHASLEKYDDGTFSAVQDIREARDKR